jgi:DNA-binding response OmpR family regulator
MRETHSRVLIVDDEVFFLEAIDEILTDAGYQTARADCGEAALERAADPEIGVVVLDVRLPDIDGIQVLACIREMRPELSIIMLSASTDQEIVLEALRLGASDYLAKPLHDEELSLAVGRALDAYEANAARRRLRERIDRLVEGMERLSQIVRLAAPAERVSVLRQGIVDSASVVLQAARASLMLADSEGEWLSVVASRGADVDPGTLSARKAGEGPSGTCFAERRVLCVPDVEGDPRFAGRGAGRY